ncbi:MAG TPA: hypothetical protein VF713_00460 [Thermoanaerobaculia bacterium]
MLAHARPRDPATQQPSNPATQQQKLIPHSLFERLPEVLRRPTAETWGEGLEVFHNPNALIPLPRKFFSHAADSVLMPDGQIESLVPDFHPYMSYSMCLPVESLQIVQDVDGITVDALTAHEFDQMKQLTEKEALFLENFAEEVEWLGDRDRGFVASVLHDFVDNDWSFVVLARDSAGEFRPIEIVCDLPDRLSARDAAVRAIARHKTDGTVAEA